MSNPFENCTTVSELCPAESIPTGAILSFGASAFFLAVFGLCFLLQLYFNIRARTWAFLIWIGIGTAFEVIGHLARAGLARRPWNVSLYLAQYIALLLAPTFIAAAISVTFKHLVLWYGSQWSVIRPSLYPWVFVGTDFISIIVQVAGAFALAAGLSGDGNPFLTKLAGGMIVGGVVFQVVNMILCMLLMVVYFLRRRACVKAGVHMIGSGVDEQGKETAPSQSASAREAIRVRKFVYAVSVAYPAIAIRCAYRILENIPAIASDIRTNEPLFLVMDATMVLISVGLMSTFHPYLFFRFLGAKGKDRLAQSHGGVQMRPIY